MLDTTPPQLVSFHFPEQIYLGNGNATVEISGTATDDLSGVKYIWIQFNRIFRFSTGSNNGLEPLRYNQYTFLSANELGTYTLTKVTVEDLQGNRTDYSFSDIQELGLPTSFAFGSLFVGSNQDDLISGSDGPDRLQGFEANDELTGGLGNDTLEGGAGLDTLVGGAGDDVLIGGVAADSMSGGSGNDTYTVALGDQIVELVDEGSDSVRSGANWTLGSNVENLVLTGTNGLRGTGNSLDNALVGNGGHNKLVGLAGADTLGGGIGNDTLVGGSGSDRLIGGLGNDILTGGTGADVFRFDAKLSTSTAANFDQITDFSVIDDVIQIENAVFTKLALGPLPANSFVRSGEGIALDTFDRIVYETDTGALYYDADGTGVIAAIQFATLSPNLALTAADFLVT
jgi:Ca2+-binding RTX toxin-like protein